ncbi:MAG: hypothetical protein MRY78_18435, partial [Saprospiraceae bacterium]|nr:hypothetical protein [Saprospiraceae bacterium]
HHKRLNWLIGEYNEKHAHTHGNLIKFYVGKNKIDEMSERGDCCEIKAVASMIWGDSGGKLI